MLFLMGGYNMSSTMLMGAMGALSWMSNMMERRVIRYLVRVLVCWVITIDGDNVGEL